MGTKKVLLSLFDISDLHIYPFVIVHGLLVHWGSTEKNDDEVQTVVEGTSLL